MAQGEVMSAEVDEGTEHQDEEEMEWLSNATAEFQPKRVHADMINGNNDLAVTSRPGRHICSAMMVTET